MANIASKEVSKRLLLSVAVASMLQTAPAVGDATNNSALVLEEILVTARKRTESIQEVPISITSFSADDIVAQGSIRLRDIATLVPNLSFTGTANPNLSNFTVRGIQAFPRATRTGFESAAPTYIDGVVRSRPTGVNLSLADVEAVEFLRGPQGTLFGRGSIGGAINITTPAPAQELRGYGEIKTGNYDLLMAQGYISGPLIKHKLAASLTAYSQERDGFDTNIYDGQDLGNADIYGGRLKLRFTPSQDLAITLSADVSKEDVFDSALEYQEGPFLIPNRERITNIDTPTLASNEQFGFDITVEYDLSSIDATLTSITAFRSFESQRAADFFILPPTVPVFGTISTTNAPDETQFSQELRLTSTGQGSFRWLAGLYYFKADLDDTISGFLPAFGPDPSVSNSNVTTHDYAIFANADWDISDTITLFGGLRLSYEDKELEQEQIAGSGAIIGTPNIPLESDSQDYTELLPTAGVRWQVSKDANLYFLVSRGYRGGGWNNKEIASSLEIESFSDLAFDPEYAWNYEVGAKTSWFENRLIANFAAFYLDYSDIQVSTLGLVEIFGTPAFVSRVQNAATATLHGVELDFQVQPTENFAIRGGLGYTHAEFDEFDTLDSAGNPADFKGNELGGSPEWTANIGGNYSKQIFADVDVVMSLVYTYRDGYFAEPGNNRDLAIDSVGLLNARIGFTDSLKESWELYFSVENLNDKEYFVSKTRGFGNAVVAAYGAPEQYSVSFRIKF